MRSNHPIEEPHNKRKNSIPQDSHFAGEDQQKNKQLPFAKTSHSETH